MIRFPWKAGLIGALMAVGCGDSKESTADCSPGEPEVHDGQKYCVYRGPIIETRFDCPEFAPFQHALEGMIVCSPGQTLPPIQGWETTEPVDPVQPTCEFGFEAPCVDTPTNMRPSADIANDLATLLWQDLPDQLLLDAAADGRLKTRSGVAGQVSRMLTDPRSKAGLSPFWVQYLKLEQLEFGAAGSTAFDATLAGKMLNSTLDTIHHITMTSAADTRAVFTSRDIVVEQQVGAIMDLQVVGLTPTLTTIPASDDRSGVLSHPAFLVGQTDMDYGRIAITSRGIAIRSMLCQDLPPPPDVVTIPQTAADGSMRDRLTQITSDPACMGCHALVDFPSFTLDGFDNMGARRATDNGFTIDSTGELDSVMLSGAADLGKAMHDDDKMAPCMTKKWLRFVVNSDVETAVIGEDPLSQALVVRWEAADYRLASLIKDILTSDAFLLVP